MGKRILFDIACLVLAFCAPWWVTFLAGILGVILFPWFIEILFLGAIYDAVFGGVARHWYGHLIHTGIFAIPLFVIEFIKPKIRW